MEVVGIVGPLTPVKTGRRMIEGRRRFYIQVNEANLINGETSRRSGISIVDSIMEKLPIVEDLVFWLLVNAIVLAYVGGYELIFHTGPGLIFSALGVVTAIIYLLLARQRYMQEVPWIVEIATLLPVIVILGDLLVTGGLTAFSVMINISSILLTYNGYKEYRRMKMETSQKTP